MTGPDTTSEKRPAGPLGALGQAVGHARFVVLIAVVAVLLVAVSLFVLGTVQAFGVVWQAWVRTFQGN